MQKQDAETFLLNHFEGPLDLLWHLIHREEIDIYEVSLQAIMEQYLQKVASQTDNEAKTSSGIDTGADFIGWAAALIWYKSRALLPKHEQHEVAEEAEVDDPRFEIIHHLLDYCRFKEAAKQLSEREVQQRAYYSRGSEDVEAPKKYLGINHLSLDDLAMLFQQLLSKVSAKRGTVHEEVWKVSDKISSLRQLLSNSSEPVLFTSLFTPEKSRDEWIVTFLALLELMKTGEARVGYDNATSEIIIFPTT